MVRISDRGMDLAVGFPGEHMKRSFVSDVTAWRIFVTIIERNHFEEKSSEFENDKH